MKRTVSMMMCEMCMGMMSMCMFRAPKRSSAFQKLFDGLKKSRCVSRQRRVSDDQPLFLFCLCTAVPAGRRC